LRPLRPNSFLPLLVLPNACTVWLGIIAGRRVRSAVRAWRVTGVILLLALVLGGAWLWRERLFPAYGVWQTLHRFQVARMDRDYAEAVTCFTEEYLRRELGAPPYASKYRKVCQREQASLRANDESAFCFHLPRHSEPVPGTSERHARIQYHYKTVLAGGRRTDPLSSVRWTWDIFLTPWRGRWLIADMRLDHESTREYFGEDVEFAERSAGTIEVLSIPDSWKVHAAGRTRRRASATSPGTLRPRPARGQ
jgi:hypothetical protein